MNVNKLINDAYQSGAAFVKIPYGIHEIQPENHTHILLESLQRDADHPFVIDATGVEFICADNQETAVHIHNCKNITLKGCKVHYKKPTMTQGEVISIAPDRKSLRVEIDKGYDGLDMDIQSTSYCFDPATRKMKHNTPDMYASSHSHIEGAVYEICYDAPGFTTDVEVGDVLCFRKKGAMAIRVDGCEKVTLKDVTVTDGCFAVLETGGEGGNIYDGVIDTYPMKPEGATRERFLSTFADSFHTSQTRKGPTIINCRFEGMGDDCINLHGVYGYFAKKDADGGFIYASPGGAIFDRVGDRIRAYDANGKPVLNSRIKAVVGAVETGMTRDDFKDVNHRFNPRGFYKVILEDEFEIPFGARVSNPDKGAKGFVIKNNHFGPNRARGILVKADDGVIEGNIFESNSIHSILVAPEFFWNESDFVRNLRIKGNTFVNSGFVTDYRPCIVIAGEYGDNGGIAHRDIIIEENVFESCNKESISAEHCDGLTIKNNTFLPRKEEAMNVKAPAILVRNCRNVKVVDNGFASTDVGVEVGNNAEVYEEGSFSL